MNAERASPWVGVIMGSRTDWETLRHAAETLRDWLYAYRRGGFEALKPRPRADLG